MTTTPVRASGNLPDKQVATCPTNKWQLAQQTSGNLPNKQVATCPTSRWQLARQATPPSQQGWVDTPPLNRYSGTYHLPEENVPMNTQDLYPIIRQWLSVRPSRQHFRALLDYLQQHLELLDEDLISYIDTHLSDWPDEERMSNGFTFYNTPLFRLVRNLVFFRHLWRDDIPLSSLTHITHLNLSHNSVNQTLIDKLHTSPLLSHLRGLKYNGYGFKDHHIQALTEVPNFQNISSLELWNTGITNAALDALAQSSHSHGLRELNLYNNKGFDDGGILSLSKSTTLTHLHALNIGYNNITMTGIQALCHSPAMKELRTLKASNLRSIRAEQNLRAR